VLLVGDVNINGAMRKRKNARTRLKVWMLRERNVRPESVRVVAESKNDVYETDNVESKRNVMKEA